MICLLVTLVQAEEKPDTIIGMYIHQHWPYNHPYAARTWTFENWKSYVGGLHRLGYNTIQIWPMLETMPDPLTESDRANLDKIGKVIDMAHEQFGMRVYIALCPNVVVDSAVAGQATFERRHFYHCDLRVNPADKEAIKRMVKRREALFRPLAKADGVTIIDSDPGGYPGSSNEEFINILKEHREMLDRLRPGIELVYWVFIGWPAHCRVYAGTSSGWGTEAEFEDALLQLKNLNPEPWGLANALVSDKFEFPTLSKKLGLESRVINFRYGAIEDEPSFPLTNYGGDRAYRAGSEASPRGVMGNAQTHCLQLPNTFAFARGARGEPVTEADYVRFANDLIPGQGPLVVEAWKALSGWNPNDMRMTADKLEQLAGEDLGAGPLGGLLFGNPQRFVTDLVMQLRLKAAYQDFYAASEKDQDVRAPFGKFVAALKAWQHRHGYKNHCGWLRLRKALKKLDSPEINRVMHPKHETNTPFGRMKEEHYKKETFIPRLIEAMETTLERM